MTQEIIFDWSRTFEEGKTKRGNGWFGSCLACILTYGTYWTENRTWTWTKWIRIHHWLLEEEQQQQEEDSA